MAFVRLLPVVLSLLVLAAHFLRAGQWPFVLLTLIVLGTLRARRPWVPRLVQFFLLFAGLEWGRTLLVLARERQARGEPWLRMALILGGVAVLTFASAAVLSRPRVRQRYGAAPGNAPADTSGEP